MKTPDEIKNGLKRCKDYPKGCEWCEFAQPCDIEADALEYIQQLEEKYKHAMENAKILSDAVTKLERERDAAKEFLRSSNHCCESCKHKPGFGYGCTSIAKADGSCWEWRGLPEV